MDTSHIYNIVVLVIWSIYNYDEVLKEKNYIIIIKRMFILYEHKLREVTKKVYT